MHHQPCHIAIIMDGNNRWALQNSIDIDKAYRNGAKAAENIINYCAEIGIRYLTLYAFSLENWSRPQNEVDIIMAIFREALLAKLDEITKRNIKVVFVGDRSRIKEDIISIMDDLSGKSESNNGLCVRIAISYSSRQEIIKAAEIAAQVTNMEYGAAFKAAINPHNIPDPDLVIRTSGEMRISNFLLWEIAYSELYFTETLWPDFNSVCLEQAINDFTLRQRRFGLR